MPAFSTVRLQGRSLQSNYFSFDETSAAYIQARFEAIRGRKGRGSVRIRCLSTPAMKFRMSAPLVPEANAKNETRIIGVAAFLASEGGGLPKCSGVGEADVRCELAADFVTDAQAGIDL
jgi:hypothetical protein